MMTGKTINLENAVNDTQAYDKGVSPGTVMGQPELGHHQATARRGWGYRINKLVMECHYRNICIPSRRGYRKRMVLSVG